MKDYYQDPNLPPGYREEIGEKPTVKRPTPRKKLTIPKSKEAHFEEIIHRMKALEVRIKQLEEKEIAFIGCCDQEITFPIFTPEKKKRKSLSAIIKGLLP